jgi:hypothetical protein
VNVITRDASPDPSEELSRYDNYFIFLSDKSFTYFRTNNVKNTILKKISRNRALLKTIDLIGSPVTLLSSMWMKYVAKGIKYLPVSNSIFMKLGVLPVRDHYYQPLINPSKHLTRS